jgi:hypothetical protein
VTLCLNYHGEAYSGKLALVKDSNGLIHQNRHFDHANVAFGQPRIDNQVEKPPLD